MDRLRALFAFPLLSKELAERAARKRTYWLRVVAAVPLYLVFWIGNYHWLHDASSAPMEVLGRGERMFEVVTVCMFVGVYLFVPAMLCGVITQEKERDSLVLLLLTRLRPWQIVLQKYLGGLIPVATIFLLALPLTAICFSYGGFSIETLGEFVIVILLAVLQAGALAIFCSAWFRTTVGAFLGTYLIGAVIAFGPLALFALNDRFKWVVIDDSWITCCHIPPGMVTSTFASSQFWASAVINLALTLALLGSAAFCLPRVNRTQSAHLLQRSFAAIDRGMHWLNRLLGGIVVGQSKADLPDGLPLVWRESRARLLANPRYVVRLSLILIVLALVLVELVKEGGDYPREEGNISALAATVGTLGILTMCAVATNSIVGERVNQTYELLLTTPMTARSIVSQKARALRPLLAVLAIPLLVIFTQEVSLEWWLLKDPAVADSYEYAVLSNRWHSNGLYLACAYLSTLIGLALVGWISLYIGLWSKTRIRAIVTALIVIIVWCVGPICLLYLLKISERDEGRYLHILSPVFIPAANEFHGLKDIEPLAPWAPVTVHLLFYGSLLYFIRWYCLANADRFLRR